MLDDATKHVLGNSGWLLREPEWVKHALFECGRFRSYKAGEFAYHADDDPGGMFGIVDGGFGVLIPSGGGEMMLCHVVRSGIWFGTGPILTTGRRTLSFRAVEPSRVVYVSLSDLNAIGARNPDFFRRLGALSESYFFAIAVGVISDLLIASGEQRIAAVLARIARPTESTLPCHNWPIRLSQAEIGQMSNSSRDRVNRALQKFAGAGWIEIDYRAITVTDLRALEDHAHGKDGPRRPP